MSESGARVPRVLAIDAGGTMTDTFIVDERGSFVVGKAQTTPEDESIGFMASARDALGQWDSTPEEGFPAIVSGIYSGTAMLNRLLQRQGLRIGCIVNAGHEDYLRLERGIQTYLGYLLLRPPAPRDPLPQRAARPARADEGRARPHRRVRRRGPAAARAGRARGGDRAARRRRGRHRRLAAVLLPQPRARDARRARSSSEEKAKRGVNGSVPVFLSSELYPMRRDLPRLNSTVIEAYAAEPSRTTLKAVRDVTKAARRAVRAAGDGRARRHDLDRGQGARHERWSPARSAASSAGRRSPQRMGLRNVLCTDIGGTSFDIALITDGRFEITQTPDIARFVLNIPLVRIDSIGAGTGSFVRVNPNSNRPELGPDSAGSRIGVCWPEGGLDTVSVTDLNLVLGPPEPGLLPRRRSRARRRAARATRSSGRSRGRSASTVDAAAAGVIELFEQTLKNEAVGRILGKGYSPADYTLLCYGGGGPLHVAGYTEDVTYAEVLVPAWAAGFSAFGCACADFDYRYDQTVDLPLLPTLRRGRTGGDRRHDHRRVARPAGPRRRRSSRSRGSRARAIRFTHAVRMQYYGQLNDIEFVSPHAALAGRRAGRRPDRRRSRTPTRRCTRPRRARRSSATWSPT